MNEEQKWDEILSADAKKCKKRQRSEKAEKAGNVIGGVSFIITIVSIIIAGAVFGILYGLR